MTRTKIIYSTILLLLAVVLISCGNEKTSNFIVKGQLNNVEGTYFYAAYEIGDTLRVDTIGISDDGKFSFSNHIDTLTVISLYFNQNTKSTYFFVDKSWELSIRGDVLQSDIILANGGAINDDLTLFKEKNKKLLLERTNILNTVANPQKNDTLQSSKSEIELTNVNFKLANSAAEFIRNNPSKEASVVLINTFFKDEDRISRLDENLDLLKGEAQYFPLTLSLKQYSEKMKKSMIGAIAPELILKNLKKKEVRIKDYRGKYLLLSFVATTCDVCNDNKKIYFDTYNQLKKEKANIDFLTVILDTEVRPIRKSESDSIKWNMVIDHGYWASKSVDLYNINEIPQNIFISPTGVILEKNISLYSLPQRIKDLSLKDEKK